jgi:hypothetical protein
MLFTLEKCVTPLKPLMKNPLKLCIATVLGAMALILPAAAQPVLVTNAPAIGTFYLLSVHPSLPWPYDPFFGTLPVYFYDGAYWVDDTELLVEGGGGMMLNSSISPGGGSGSSLTFTNTCSGPTNFTITYQLSATNIPPYGTNDLWLEMKMATNNVAHLTIHTPTTNAPYDVFGTTNLSPHVLPLNLTNWMWLQRATGVDTNFVWTNITHCAGAWFQLGTMQDDDGDGMTSAYEGLVSNTSTNNSDTDGDGRADGQEFFFDGTNPRAFNPQRLAHFPFNDTNWLGSVGQTPLAVSNATSRDAWFSKALQIDNSGYSLLKFRTVEADLNANLLLHQGSIRFWFKSNWDTGTGTSKEARLIEVGTKGTGTTNGWWALYFSKTNGTEITFAAETNNAGATYLTATNSWRRYDWNQFVLNYTATNSALYLNSSLISTGLGVTLWPGATVRANGFRVGSDANGTNQAQGTFEDLEILNYPLSTNDIAQNFQTNRPPNAIADLKLWLKADAGIITNDAYARVSRWQDQSGSGNDATQSMMNLQPYFFTNALNERPIVRFLSNHFSFSGFLTGNAPAHAFLVLKATTNNPAADSGLWRFGSVGGNYPKAGGAVHESFGGGVPYVLGIFAEDISDYHIMDVAVVTNVSSTNWSLSYNGVTKDFRRSHTTSFASEPLLGNSGGSDFLGDIAELLLYRKVLTTVERQSIVNYLQAKYAVLPVPPVPNGLNALGISSNQVSLWWNADFLPAQNWIKIERSSGGGAFSEIGAVAGASFVDTNLVGGTVYTYRLRGSSDRASDSSYSTNITVTTPTTGANIPLANSVIWLKADCGTTRGTSGSLSNTMSTWLDQSGRANHALRAVVEELAAPEILSNGWNGRPVTRWGTALGTRLNLPRISDLTGGETFIAVKVITNRTGFSPSLWILGRHGTVYPPNDTDPRTLDYFGSTTPHEITSSVLTNRIFHLYNAASSNNYWSAQFNNETRVTSAINTVLFAPESASGPAIGWGGNGFIGEILEFVLFERVLSDPERTTVRNYFNSKYNLWTP